MTASNDDLSTIIRQKVSIYRINENTVHISNSGFHGDITGYSYNAGINPDSINKQQYNGYKTASGSYTSNVPNGWYVAASIGQKQTRMLLERRFGGQYLPFDFQYIQNGKIIEYRIVEFDIY